MQGGIVSKMKINKRFAELQNKIQDKFNGHVNVFYYLFAVVKYILERQNIPDQKNNGVISLTFAIILSPITFFIILLFKIYRLVVHLILKLAHGSKLYSMLDGTDTIFCIGESETSRSVVTALLLVDYPGTGEEFYARAKLEIETIFSRDKFNKLHVTRKGFMGYNYYKVCEKFGEEHLKSFAHGQGDISRGQLQKYISEFVNKKFPHEDRSMWDVYIGKQRVEDKSAFPLIFRFHHSLGDATTVFNIFSRDFTDKCNDGSALKEMVLRPRPVVANSLKDSFLKTFVLIDEYDRSVLCDANICGDKHLVWFSDDDSRYIDLVKSIKKKHGSANFVDVILTAVSASLYGYACKKSSSMPTIMHSVVTLMPKSNKPYKFGEVDDYKLGNKFTIAMVRLPLKTQSVDQDADLLKRLKMVCEDYNIMKNKALDTSFNRWQGRVLFTALPTQIIGPMYKCGQPTMLFSNITGCDHLDIFGGCPVKEFVIFDPNVAVSGISVMVTTYENRLNIAFTFDKSIVPKQEDAQEICNNVLRKIERLDEIL